MPDPKFMKYLRVEASLWKYHKSTCCVSFVISIQNQLLLMIIHLYMYILSSCLQSFVIIRLSTLNPPTLIFKQWSKYYELHHDVFCKHSHFFFDKLTFILENPCKSISSSWKAQCQGVELICHSKTRNSMLTKM